MTSQVASAMRHLSHRRRAGEFGEQRSALQWTLGWRGAPSPHPAPGCTWCTWCTWYFERSFAFRSSHFSMILNVLFALLKAYITHLDSAGIYNHRAAFRTDPDRSGQVVVRFFVHPRRDGDDFASLVTTLQDATLGSCLDSRIIVHFWRQQRTPNKTKLRKLRKATYASLCITMPMWIHVNTSNPWMGLVAVPGLATAIAR